MNENLKPLTTTQLKDASPSEARVGAVPLLNLLIATITASVGKKARLNAP